MTLSQTILIICYLTILTFYVPRVSKQTDSVSNKHLKLFTIKQQKTKQPTKNKLVSEVTNEKQNSSSFSRLKIITIKTQHYHSKREVILKSKLKKCHLRKSWRRI